MLKVFSKKRKPFKIFRAVPSSPQHASPCRHAAITFGERPQRHHPQRFAQPIRSASLLRARTERGTRVAFQAAAD